MITQHDREKPKSVDMQAIDCQPGSNIEISGLQAYVNLVRAVALRLSSPPEQARQDRLDKPPQGDPDRTGGI